MNSVKKLLEARGDQVWSIGPDATVFEAIELLDSKNVGALMVVDGDKTVGIMSERDYVRKVAIKGRSSANTPVRDIMTSKIIHVEVDATIDDCMSLMTEKHIRHLPVFNEGKLAGVISLGDLVKIIIQEQQKTIEQLGQYISG